MQQNNFVDAHNAALFNRYGQVIFIYVLGQSASREDAEDLTLEVFTAALEKNNLTTLSDDQKLSWLRRVARNKLIDHYRRSQHRSSVTLEHVAELLGYEESPEFLALQNEAYRELRQTLKQLSPLQQQLLYWRYGSSLRVAEIAVMLDKSEEAVRQLLSRTIRLLRGIYLSQIHDKGGNFKSEQYYYSYTYFTNDGGRRWTLSEKSFPVPSYPLSLTETQHITLFIRPMIDGQVAPAQFPLFTWQDTSWIQAGTFILPRATLFSIDYFSERIAFIVTPSAGQTHQNLTSLTIQKTVDAGQTWKPIGVLSLK